MKSRFTQIMNGHYIMAMFFLCLMFNGNNGFGQWIQVGTDFVTSEISLASNGTIPYAATNEFALNFEGSVYNNVGAAWIPTGLTGFTNTPIGYQDLEFDGTAPYLLFNDSVGLSLVTYNGLNWTYVGETHLDTVYYSGQLAFDDSTKYVAYLEVIDSTQGMSMKTYNGLGWQYLGEPIELQCTSGCPIISTFKVHNSVPYVMGFGAGGYSVRKFDGSNWINAAPPVEIGSVMEADFEFYQDTLYMLYWRIGTYEVVVKKFDGVNWAQIGPTISLGGSNVAFEMNIDFGNDSQPYISWVDDSYQITVRKLIGGNWVMAGNYGDLPNASYYDIEIINDVPYVAYDYGANAKVYRLLGSIGIEEELLLKVLIYPNPSNSLITIECTELTTIDQISIVSITGQNIFNQCTNLSNSVTLNCSEFVPGIYFVKIQSEGATLVKNIIIQ